MDIADIVLALLVIGLVGWSTMSFVSANNLSAAINDIALRQAVQADTINGFLCQEKQGYELVGLAETAEGNLLIEAGKNRDLNQSYLCIYKKS